MHQEPSDKLSVMQRHDLFPVIPIVFVAESNHLLKSGKDIRLIQELLGHSDVNTNMIYTHVIGKGGLAVPSRFDQL
jgi:integrase